jgi:hypothetical protein
MAGSKIARIPCHETNSRGDDMTEEPQRRTPGPSIFLICLGALAAVVGIAALFSGLSEQSSSGTVAIGLEALASALSVWVIACVITHLSNIEDLLRAQLKTLRLPEQQLFGKKETA